MKAKGLIALGLLALATQGAELPPLVLPEGVGVNIHFTRGHEKDLDLIAAAGFKFIRMDFGWQSTERQKAEYNWEAYDELTANLEKRSLRPIYILDYSNPLYEPSASPQHPESVAAFAKWSAAAAEHFRGHHVIWEIWNEPNISFWKPKPDVKQYTTLALATCKAIRESAPRALIMAPASSAFPWPFLEDFLSSGVLQYLDAVSVHPYRDYRRPPESTREDYRRLRALIERYAPTEAKRKLPIVSGEWGYATHQRGGVSLETQAAFAVRQQLSNLLNEVPISIWYDWKNDGPDAAEREHNFGTVTPDLKPKPAYVAIRTLTHELAGYRIDRRLELPSEKDYVLVLVNSTGSRKLAAWTLGDTHSVALDLPVSGEVSGVTGTGERYTPKIESDRLVVDLESLPRYINLPAAK